ncbi:MAG: DUF6152 family protein [Woeseiaceae bacterium]
MHQVESDASFNIEMLEKKFMRRYPNFTVRRFLCSMLVVLLPAAVSNAHHSFAPYDIYNPIEITGVAEAFPWRRPHPILTVVDDKGVSWQIEVPSRGWDRAEIPHDAIVEGDKLRIRGFPARNGSNKMALSGFEVHGTYHTVRDTINQRSAVQAAEAIESGESLESAMEKYDKPSEPREGREGRPERPPESQPE